MAAPIGAVAYLLFRAGRALPETGEVVVPPDSYFAMGDKRDASLDSRYWGFVPRANLVGAPWIAYGSNEAPAVSGSAMDRIVDRYQYFFTRMRWRRTFMAVS